VEANTFKRLKQGSLISPNGCFLSATGLVLVLLLLLGFISLLVLLARLVCLLTRVALLVGAAVEEIHFRKSLIDFHKDACQLLMVDVIWNDIQNGAQLLVFLLQTQFLVHVCNALLQTSLESWDLITELLLLVFRSLRQFEFSLELIDTSGGLLAVVCESLHFAATFHSSRHIHAAVHLLRDLGQRRHIFRCVVSQIETSAKQIDLGFWILLLILIIIWAIILVILRLIGRDTATFTLLVLLVIKFIFIFVIRLLERELLILIFAIIHRFFNLLFRAIDHSVSLFCSLGCQFRIALFSDCTLLVGRRACRLDGSCRLGSLPPFLKMIQSATNALLSWGLHCLKGRSNRILLWVSGLGDALRNR
jgi:hypothetical protein